MKGAASVAVGVSLLVGACNACPREEPGADAAGQQPAASATAAADSARADSLARIRAETAEVTRIIQERVHFDFDRSTIRPGQDTEVLRRKVAILNANPGLTLQITGHCDSRGPSSYNMALGERRARAAMQFLTSQGIAANRMSVRSMGEDQPLVSGQNQDAWRQNRRAEFEITAGGGQLRRP